MDESSKQLIKETCAPNRGSSNHIEYYYSKYDHNGTANLFLFFNPIEGWLSINVTNSRPAEDSAYQIGKLVDGDYLEVVQITLVMDNLNAHVVHLYI